MANKKAPVKDAWHGYNNKHAVPPVQDIDILHMANQLFPFGLLTSADTVRFASFLHSRMQGKAFVHNGQSWRIVKVFSAGETCIKARVEPVPADFLHAVTNIREST